MTNEKHTHKRRDSRDSIEPQTTGIYLPGDKKTPPPLDTDTDTKSPTTPPPPPPQPQTPLYNPTLHAYHCPPQVPKSSTRRRMYIPTTYAIAFFLFLVLESGALFIYTIIGLLRESPVPLPGVGQPMMGQWPVCQYAIAGVCTGANQQQPQGLQLMPPVAEPKTVQITITTTIVSASATTVVSTAEALSTRISSTASSTTEASVTPITVQSTKVIQTTLAVSTKVPKAVTVTSFVGRVVPTS